MTNRVLDQWLQKQIRNPRNPGIRIDPHLNGQALAHSGLFDLEIHFQKINFLFEGDFVDAIRLERDAK